MYNSFYLRSLSEYKITININVIDAFSMELKKRSFSVTHARKRILNCSLSITTCPPPRVYYQYEQDDSFFINFYIEEKQ